MSDYSSTPLGWRHYPWLLGLSLSPLLLGSVDSGAQAAVGLCLALSVALLWRQLGGQREGRPICHPFLLALGFLLLVLPVIPLPRLLVEWVSPQRIFLARQFPLEGQDLPAWIPLSAAPAASLLRLWRLSLVLTVFVLARQGAADRVLARPLVLCLTLTLFCLALSEVGFRLGGRKLLLGLVQDPAGHGAGTFRNWNHFANWMVVASLFAGGWILKQVWPMHSSRSESSRGLALVQATVLGFALLMVMLSGSRGGALALGLGWVVWLILLHHKLPRRKSSLGALVLCGLVLLGCLASSSEHLLQRLSEAGMDFGFKWTLWKESIRLGTLFPLFGVGWGGFQDVFTYYKRFKGDGTFLYAENEVIELLVECGLAGLLVYGAILWKLGRQVAQTAWNQRTREPELTLGAVAALAAYLAHAQVEFVFQVPATALLAAALLGFVLGLRPSENRANRPPTPLRSGLNLAWALALLLLAGLQGMSFLWWQKGLRTVSLRDSQVAMEASRRWWPWEVDRSIALTRVYLRLWSQTAQESHRVAARQEINRGIAGAPYRWPLRLERAIVDITTDSNRNRSLTEAWEVVRLNPLQQLLPLRFAEALVHSAPEQAWQFLLKVPPTREHQKKLLELGWSVNKSNPNRLWSLTAATPEGWQALGDLAVNKGLFSLAAQAYPLLSNHVDPPRMAQNLLAARRPLLALQSLETSTNGMEEKLLRSRAYLALENYGACIQNAEEYWRGCRVLTEILLPTPTTGLSRQRLNLRRQEVPNDVDIALQWAEKVATDPFVQEDLDQLRRLVSQFPKELRLSWLLFSVERRRKLLREAAHTAVSLATAAREQSGVL